MVVSYAEMLCHVGNLFIDFAVKCRDGIDMVVGAGHDGGARGRADGVCGVAVVEFHAFYRPAVEVRSVVDGCTVAADRFRRMVIGHDEDDVGFGRHGRRRHLW